MSAVDLAQTLGARLGNDFCRFSPLAIVIRWNTQPETDLTLSTLPGREQTLVPTVAPSRAGQPDSSGNPQSNVATPDGSWLYLEACAACHSPDAGEIENQGDPLLTSDVLELPDDEALAFVRAGVDLANPRNITGLEMPPSGGRTNLDDEKLISLLEFYVLKPRRLRHRLPSLPTNACLCSSTIRTQLCSHTLKGKALREPATLYSMWDETANRRQILPPMRRPN